MKSSRLTVRVCLALLAVLWFAQPGALAAAETEVRVTKVNLRLPSGSIQAELFELASKDLRPAIVVLHGAGGTLLDGPEMRRVARSLAEKGNAAYLVRYFERTGTLFALDGAMQRNFSAWKGTVQESLVAIQRLRGSSAPLGIYGYSLGGFLALSSASNNPRVGAVVEHAGGVWNGKMERIGKMPAVLMVHGQRDGRVPFDQYARPLQLVLQKRATALETRFFPEEDHTFSPAAMVEVRAAAAAFFQRHLRARPAKKSPP